MNLILRGVITLCGLIILWQCTVFVFNIPPYILPTPWMVLKSIYQQQHLLMLETIPTVTETLIGLIFGILVGCLAALLLAYYQSLTLWFLPLLIISQAIPTFAIAPLLVLWFGYGMTAKIATTVLMIFFPITSAFFDGLRSTELPWLDLAASMNAKKFRLFWYIRIPSALSRLASGMRVAAVIAPIGAIIGEWVGASQGLGYLMLNANARLQIDLMFAALIIIVIFSLLLYFCIDMLLKKISLFNY